MSRRLIEKALRDNGCSVKRTTGGHDVWGCPCGSHSAPVPRHNEISAGVVGSIEKQMVCLSKGWLQ
jgi:predicted RNA binding protein YcfA (HicA-like mRNA interferase family)